MESLGSVEYMLGVVAERAMAAQTHDSTDYMHNGLLYCGKCKTPKQTEISIPGINGRENKSVIVSCLCNCASKQLEDEKAEEKAEERNGYIKSLKRLSLMDDGLLEQTFDTYDPAKGNEKTIAMCKRYVSKFDELLKKNQGLLFWGDVGTGKTFCAACIANALLDKGVSVVMASFIKLMDMFKTTSEAEELYDRLNKVKLLIIDDFGAERNTEYAAERVYNIIDTRYKARLPIILTTNRSIKNMQSEEDLKGKRVYDRIFEMCYPVHFSGTSIRKLEAARRFNEAKELLFDGGE